MAAQTLSTSTVNMNSGSTVLYRGDNDAAADTYVLNTLSSDYHNLTISSFDGDTDEFELSGTLTVNGTLGCSVRTFDFNGQNTNITGNWIMGTGESECGGWFSRH